MAGLVRVKVMKNNAIIFKFHYLLRHMLGCGKSALMQRKVMTYLLMLNSGGISHPALFPSRWARKKLWQGGRKKSKWNILCLNFFVRPCLAPGSARHKKIILGKFDKWLNPDIIRRPCFAPLLKGLVPSAHATVLYTCWDATTNSPQ